MTWYATRKLGDFRGKLQRTIVITNKIVDMQKPALLQGLKKKMEEERQKFAEGIREKKQGRGWAVNVKQAAEAEIFWGGFWRPWSNAKQHIWLWQRTRADVCVWERRRDGQSLRGRRKWTKLTALSSENLGEMFSFHSRTFSARDRLFSAVSGDRGGEAKKTGTFYLRRGQKQTCSPWQTIPFPSLHYSQMAHFSHV